MSVHKLSLQSHPTVITSTNTSGAFEGWGVRIG
jgi:hypothetical protein